MVLSVVLLIFCIPNSINTIFLFFKIFETIVIADLIYLDLNREKFFNFSFYVYYFAAFMYSLKVDQDGIKEGVGLHHIIIF
jgi:hypothetical protein